MNLPEVIIKMEGETKACVRRSIAGNEERIAAVLLAFVEEGFEGEIPSHRDVVTYLHLDHASQFEPVAVALHPVNGMWTIFVPIAIGVGQTGDVCLIVGESVAHKNAVKVMGVLGILEGPMINHTHFEEGRFAGFVMDSVVIRMVAIAYACSYLWQETMMQVKRSHCLEVAVVFAEQVEDGRKEIHRNAQSVQQRIAGNTVCLRQALACGEGKANTQ